MKDIARAKADEMYASVPDWIKDNIGEAYKWAFESLTAREGQGHEIVVTACWHQGVSAGLVQCSFAKPSWSGDHCGSGMESASQAIVMSVCEYFSGC